MLETNACALVHTLSCYQVTSVSLFSLSFRDFCMIFPAPIRCSPNSMVFTFFSSVYQCSTVLALVSKIVSVFVFLFTWEDTQSLSSSSAVCSVFQVIFYYFRVEACMLFFFFLRLIFFFSFFRLSSPPSVDHDQGALCRIGRRKVKKRKCVQ